MTYTTPQNINNKRIFLVSFREIKDRLDAQYYKEHFNFENYVKLSSVAIVKGGKRIPVGETYATEETPYIYLRVADITEDGNVNFGSVKYIDESIFNELEHYEFANGEIALSIAGTIGKVMFFEDMPTNKRAILTENCAKIIPKSNDTHPLFLSIVLSLPCVQKQNEINYIQTTIPKLGLDRVKSTMIPPIPPMEKQLEMVSLYQSALKEKQTKEQEAIQLINSISDYVLKELGISIPQIGTALTDRIFTTSFQHVRANRFDPKGSLVLGEHASSSTLESVPLKNIANICKGDSLTSDEADLTGEYPVIAGGQTSPYNHSKANYQGNVITISASGAYSGYVWYHDYPIYATDCCVVKSKDESQYLTTYIFEVLKAQQERIYMYQQGAGQPHVYASDLEKLMIPILPLNKQQEIVAHAQQIRAQALEIKDIGIDKLNKVRKQIESTLTGNLTNKQ